MKRIVIVVLISLGLLFLDYFGALRWMKTGFSQIIGWRKRVYSSLVSGQTSKKELEQKLVSCQADLIELEEENLQAQRLLGAKVKPETSFDLAKFISLGDQTAILAVNNPELIKKSASVVTGSLLVGKVKEVQGQTAEIDLLISSNTKLPVKIWPDQNKADARVGLIGEGILTGDGQKLLVEEVLDSQKIRSGDWVGTIAVTGDLFWIGQVGEVFPSEDKVFQQAEVVWAVDLNKLLTVGIVK